MLDKLTSIKMSRFGLLKWSCMSSKILYKLLKKEENLQLKG
jgi:hypothetical protein